MGLSMEVAVLLGAEALGRPPGFLMEEGWEACGDAQDGALRGPLKIRLHKARSTMKVTLDALSE